MTILNTKMGGTDPSDGSVLNAADWKATFDAVVDDNDKSLVGEGLNLIRQLQNRSITFSKGGFDWFGDAYVDANGQKNSVDTGKTTDSFSTDKYTAVDFDSMGYFVIIYADTCPDITDYSTTTKRLSEDSWVVYGASRNNVLAALFDSSANIESVTGLTAIETSETDDVGMRFNYLKISASHTSTTENAQVTGTFTDTSSNKMWSASNLNLSTTDNNTDFRVRWEAPSGTSLHSHGASSIGGVPGYGISNEIGSGGDYITNPATAEYDHDTGNNDAGSTSGEIIVGWTSGTVSWGTASTANASISIDTEYTFSSVPAFTALSSDYRNTIITHKIPSGTFSSTISSCIGVPMIEDWETGANINYKIVNATEDSGWLDYNERANFTAFTARPVKVIVKLIPKTTSPSAGFPSILGFSIKEL